MLVSCHMHRVPGALKPLIYPIALAYAAAVRTRNAMYDSGICRRRSLKGLTISIGNLTTGGTGKTPLVAYTAAKLMELGYLPVVLTRGYGRRGSGRTLVIDPGKQIENAACEMGDEPAVLRRHIPQAWFGIAKSRFDAGKRIHVSGKLLSYILDDGFQHRKLRRNLDIAVIDATQPLSSNRMFPVGTLREPLSGLRRSHAIVLNGGSDGNRDAAPILEELRTLAPEAELFLCEQYIEMLLPLEVWQKEKVTEHSQAPPRSVFAVAALGNPVRFARDVGNLGIEVAGRRFFRDHYSLQSRDWSRCAQAARIAGIEALVTTEKDAIKIASHPDIPVFVAIQATRMLEEERFVSLLKRHAKTSAA